MGGQQKDFISDIVFFQHQDGMRLKVQRHFLQCVTLAQRVLNDLERFYKAPGFLAVIWFGSSPTPHPRFPSASCLSFSDFLHMCMWRKSSILTGEVGRGWERSQIIRQRESMVLCKHSILSALTYYIYFWRFWKLLTGVAVRHMLIKINS